MPGEAVGCGLAWLWEGRTDLVSNGFWFIMGGGGWLDSGWQRREEGRGRGKICTWYCVLSDESDEGSALAGVRCLAQSSSCEHGDCGFDFCVVLFCLSEAVESFRWIF